MTECAVFSQDAQSYADDNSLLFMETSAKTSMNVNEIFMAIGRFLRLYELKGFIRASCKKSKADNSDIKSGLLTASKSLKWLCIYIFSVVVSPSSAKRLPKSEPQAPGANSGRSRGVDLTETAQPTKAPCCSN